VTLGVGQGVVGHPVVLKKHPEMVLEKPIWLVVFRHPSEKYDINMI